MLCWQNMKYHISLWNKIQTKFIWLKMLFSPYKALILPGWWLAISLKQRSSDESDVFFKLTEVINYCKDN